MKLILTKEVRSISAIFSLNSPMTSRISIVCCKTAVWWCAGRSAVPGDSTKEGSVWRCRVPVPVVITLTVDEQSGSNVSRINCLSRIEESGLSCCAIDNKQIHSVSETCGVSARVSDPLLDETKRFNVLIGAVVVKFSC